MPITLDGKLGQLLSDGDFVGTAWLLSEELAISAYHCLLGKDNKMRTNFTIKFPAFEMPIDVSPDDNWLDSALDVTVLKITKNHDYNLEPLVIDMSRTEIAQGDDVYIGGYPELSQDMLPNGNLTPAIVEQPDWPVSTSRRITMSYPGGEPPNITGVSGGPLVLKSDQSAAIGLICSKYDDVQSLYATSIFNVVKRFPGLEPLLLSSRHIDSRSKRLCIDQTQDGQMRWSCSVPIDEAEKLWEDPSLVTHASCMFSLSNPSVASDTLKRLFWNGGFTEVSSFKANQTLSTLERKFSYSIEEMLPPSNCIWKDYPQTTPSIHAVCDLPSTPQQFSIASFSEQINNSLDSYVLKKINQQMEECDSGGLKGIVGCDVNLILWRRMFEIWNEWYNLLVADEKLRHQYLTHCLLATATSEIFPSDSMFLGPRTNILRLTKPTIMALALAASDVSLKPHLSNPGNLEIETKTGHACGLERFSGGDVLYASSNPWTTKVVILPYLKSAYLELWELRQPLRTNNSSATPKTNEPGLPPVVLTADIQWQLALETGKDSVKEYYQMRCDEFNTRQAKQVLQPRDGGLTDAT